MASSRVLGLSGFNESLEESDGRLDLYIHPLYFNVDPFEWYIAEVAKRFAVLDYREVWARVLMGRSFAEVDYKRLDYLEPVLSFAEHDPRSAIDLCLHLQKVNKKSKVEYEGRLINYALGESNTGVQLFLDIRASWSETLNFFGLTESDSRAIVGDYWYFKDQAASDLESLCNYLSTARYIREIVISGGYYAEDLEFSGCVNETIRWLETYFRKQGGVSPQLTHNKSCLFISEGDSIFDGLETGGS